MNMGVFTRNAGHAVIILFEGNKKGMLALNRPVHLQRNTKEELIFLCLSASMFSIF